MKVHISHKGTDFPFAKKLATGLRKAGIQPNYLNLFEACGEVINSDYSALTAKLREFDYLIAVISKEYLASAWHSKELFAALLREQANRSRFVVAVVVDDAQCPAFVSNPITGERPNCYMEVGYALALGKELILSAKNEARVHFDLQERRALLWDTHKHFADLLDKRLKAIKGRSVY